MYISTFIINKIIVPHGITDFTHSIQTNKLDLLFGIYVSNILLSPILEPIYNPLLYVGSIIHFKKDIQNPFLFVETLRQIHLHGKTNRSMCILYLFMLFIHIPNHYKEHLWHMKQQKWLNGISILFMMGISSYFYPIHKPYIRFIKSFVLSHIIYNEIGI